MKVSSKFYKSTDKKSKPSPDGRDIGVLSVILLLIGPWRLGFAPPGGKNPKPGGLGPGNPLMPPIFGGNPRLGSGGVGPNPRGLGKFCCCCCWCLLVSGSGVLLVNPFSLGSDSFLSSSWTFRIKYANFCQVLTFFLLRCKCVIIAWSRSLSCNTQNMIRW